ncbi:MAG TPA: sodium:solute symporter [Phycisphaerales bacterium]|nr:sodium:solute symporter [Phycisphaerales bacterium]|tara:strand:- start:80226 stop:81779 length:1554 start_codon:yes stop_codon:yes gene_type:complete
MLAMTWGWTLNLSAVIVYLLGTIAIGIYFSRKNTNTEEYFVGGRSLPGWVVGLSMVGTSLSSITFLAFPAAAYSLDWRQFIINLMLPIGVVSAYFIFIPFFRRSKITSTFEYLEMRFHPFARFYASITFLFGQFLRLGVVLYLASLAISALLDVNVITVMIITGLFITFYTVLGGIDAVIWTDVMQTIILLFGGLFCLLFLVFQLPEGVGQLMEIANAHDKFSFGPMTWDLNDRTAYTLMILGVIGWTKAQCCDQNVVQRYLAAASLKEARKATLISMCLCLPTWAMFFLIGTILFVYFKVVPDPAITDMPTDQIFPYFIMHKLPVGVAGIIIAAALAAAMSSLDSNINTVTLLVVHDLFRRHLTPGRNDRFYLKLAWLIATLTGFAMIAIAIIFYYTPKESVVDTLILVGSLVGGPVLAMYLLGFFTTRMDGRSLLITMALVGILHVFLLLNAFNLVPDSMHLELHNYWVGIVLDASFITFGYLLSWIIPTNPKNLEGLTVWSTNSAPNPIPGKHP